MTTATDRRPCDPALPPFEAHPWVRGGHAQTIVGRYFPDARRGLAGTRHEIVVEGGDRLSVLETIPRGWPSRGPSAVLVHGLGGSAVAPYMVRLAFRLDRLGVRVVRMDLRGAGAGFGIARGIYHAGRTDDLRRVVGWLACRAPGTAVALAGFSLGANLVLKLAAEAATDPLAGLDCVLAANPPLDLDACCRHLMRPQGRLYDRSFVRLLRGEVARLHAAFPELGPVDLGRVRTLYDFDDGYTAPRNGFAGARDYYEQSSAGPLIPRIRVPGLVVHAEDDPFIPLDPFHRIAFPPGLALELIPGGGHLGYFSRFCWDGDHRWLEARLAAWLATRWAAVLSNRDDTAPEHGDSTTHSGRQDDHA